MTLRRGPGSCRGSGEDDVFIHLCTQGLSGGTGKQRTDSLAPGTQGVQRGLLEYRWPGVCKARQQCRIHTLPMAGCPVTQ